MFWQFSSPCAHILTIFSVVPRRYIPGRHFVHTSFQLLPWPTPLGWLSDLYQYISHGRYWIRLGACRQRKLSCQPSTKSLVTYKYLEKRYYTGLKDWLLIQQKTARWQTLASFPVPCPAFCRLQYVLQAMKSWVWDWERG